MKEEETFALWENGRSCDGDAYPMEKTEVNVSLSDILIWTVYHSVNFSQQPSSKKKKNRRCQRVKRNNVSYWNSRKNVLGANDMWWSHIENTEQSTTQ